MYELHLTEFSFTCPSSDLFSTVVLFSRLPHTCNNMIVNAIFRTCVSYSRHVWYLINCLLSKKIKKLQQRRFQSCFIIKKDVIEHSVVILIKFIINKCLQFINPLNMKNQRSVDLLIHGDIKYFLSTVSVIILHTEHDQFSISALQEKVALV